MKTIFDYCMKNIKYKIFEIQMRQREKEFIDWLINAIKTIKRLFNNLYKWKLPENTKFNVWCVKKYFKKRYYLFIWWQETKWLYHKYQTNTHTHKTIFNFIYNMKLKIEKSIRLFIENE